jgi:hypothetical protein
METARAARGNDHGRLRIEALKRANRLRRVHVDPERVEALYSVAGALLAATRRYADVRVSLATTGLYEPASGAMSP